MLTETAKTETAKTETAKIEVKAELDQNMSPFMEAHLRSLLERRGGKAELVLAEFDGSELPENATERMTLLVRATIYLLARERFFTSTTALEPYIADYFTGHPVTPWGKRLKRCYMLLFRLLLHSVPDWSAFMAQRRS